MAKRTATTELTDRNWDHEDEPEEAGEFAQASTDAMKHRQIIKAKRKSNNEGGSKSFTGFSGFSFKPTSTSTPFSFNVKSVTNGQSETMEKPVSVIPVKAFPPATSPVKSTPASNGDTKTASGESATCNTYSENLRKLNESVLSWIQKHVEKNAYCILTPIFKDYEKHLDELEKEKSESTTKNNGTETKTAATSSAITTGINSASSSFKPAFSFGTSATATPSSGFTFGSKATTVPPAGAKGSNEGSTFGAAAATGTGFSGFNLQSNLGAKPSPFFAVGQSTGAMGSSQDAEEDEYQPPKPESTEVKEEGALHTVKCKLFYQKAGAWTERGVGFLHIKKSNEKAQLVVRADTTLGNILLNIILSSSLPLNRQGKNNVSLMCVPNPPLDSKTEPKATAMLIRVKTAEDADTLLEKMKELRK